MTAIEKLTPKLTLQIVFCTWQWLNGSCRVYIMHTSFLGHEPVLIIKVTADCTYLK